MIELGVYYEQVVTRGLHVRNIKRMFFTRRLIAETNGHVDYRSSSNVGLDMGGSDSIIF